MKKRPPYVSKYADRHGKVRWRFRKRGHDETQTTAVYDTPGWWSWYFAALKGQPRQIGSDRTSPGTFNSLIVAYYQSSGWKLLRSATQTAYRGEIERFRSAHGTKRVNDLKSSHIARMMDLKADQPAAANNLLRVLRVLMSFAQSRGWRSDNPADGVKKLIYRSDGFHSWTDGEIAQFEKRWPVGTRERLAFDLLLYTGQRSADVRTMTRSQVGGSIIWLKQQKTDERLEIPIHPALSASLDRCGGIHPSLITTQYGEPFSAKGFGNWISAAAERAGLPAGCSAHGLRKAAARRLAEAGCTPHQIAAITGHKSLKEIERYTRAVDQRMSAEAAMRKVQEARNV
ncbi:tyrosine-type recombinase/integrase [Caulobacter sp. 602-2]|uniref:Tyrosine-type recombinase/integrase n=1 Tax=Caulobacter sp. 602-2 TaxID=2710887 RepID=A0A6G4QUK8_9CAUL|nr:tyrosine-type recombinase/integrase [Caulobacter sp. 602-2]NGM49231.1 tyrosine-type recombinase/integrase [Caulobacter sp. 602-2]